MPTSKSYYPERGFLTHKDKAKLKRRARPSPKMSDLSSHTDPIAKKAIMRCREK